VQSCEIDGERREAVTMRNEQANFRFDVELRPYSSRTTFTWLLSPFQLAWSPDHGRYSSSGRHGTTRAAQNRFPEIPEASPSTHFRDAVVPDISTETSIGRTPAVESSEAHVADLIMRIFSLSSFCSDLEHSESQGRRSKELQSALYHGIDGCGSLLCWFTF
jgi:hypothetical protein